VTCAQHRHSSPGHSHLPEALVTLTRQPSEAGRLDRVSTSALAQHPAVIGEVLSEDISRVAIVPEALRALGAQIAIDDFGTSSAYSPISPSRVQPPLSPTRGNG
jgi:hypothetical protein